MLLDSSPSLIKHWQTFCSVELSGLSNFGRNQHRDNCVKSFRNKAIPLGMSLKKYILSSEQNGISSFGKGQRT